LAGNDEGFECALA
jgi:AhpD family alkylhydroperoxidase